MPDQRRAIAALRALPKDSESIVLLSPPPARSQAMTPAACVRDRSPNAVTVDMLWPQAGPPGGPGVFLLFLADTYAPGWHAYGDGAEWPVQSADVAFRVAAIRPSLQHVDFRYEPGPYRVGLFVTLIALAGLGVAVGISVRRAGASTGTPAAERGGG